MELDYFLIEASKGNDTSRAYPVVKDAKEFIRFLTHLTYDTDNLLELYTCVIRKDIIKGVGSAYFIHDILIKISKISREEFYKKLDSIKNRNTYVDDSLKENSNHKKGFLTFLRKRYY